MGLVLLTLTACQPLPAAPTVNPTPNLQATIQPTQADTNRNPVSAPTPTQPRTAVCSPLEVQALESLSQIITQPFQMPRVLDNGEYADDAHHGVDLGYYTREGELFTGTNVLAVMDGIIAGQVVDRPPYGYAILVETPYQQVPDILLSRLNLAPGASIYTLYGHLQNPQTFFQGETVHCGNLLAQTGLTGFTGGPHLHLEARSGPAGRSFDSMGYYRADLTHQEMENYRSWRMSGEFQLIDPMDLFQK